MPLIILIAALCALRALEVWRFAQLSWWIIVALMVFAFVWFEFVEKVFALDKKKAHEALDSRRAARVRQTFAKRKT